MMLLNAEAPLLPCVDVQLYETNDNVPHQTVCMGSTMLELMRWRPLAASATPSATHASKPLRPAARPIVYAPYAATRQRELRQTRTRVR